MADTYKKICRSYTATAFHGESPRVPHAHDGARDRKFCRDYSASGESAAGNTAKAGKKSSAANEEFLWGSVILFVTSGE